MRGIYVHIPFCVRKCPYCSFASYSGAEQMMDAYERRLIKEIEDAPRIEADTIYFGGGTPTYFGAARLCSILKCIKDKFDIKKNAEITVEANPGTVSERDFEKLFGAGFNRVSMGIQSLQSDELKSLGRIHSAGEAIAAVKAAYSAGFRNISGDIMFGTEGQSIESLKKTLCEFMQLPLTHISAYSLSVEEGTPYFDNPPQLPDEDTEREMYWLIGEYIRDYGFDRYEISNYAKKGFESRHNMKYWLGEEYLGLGAGAHSYMNGVRYCNTAELDDYIAGKDIKRDAVQIDSTEKEKEYYMLGLRIKEGVPEKYHPNIEKLISAGLIERADGRIRLTDRGTDLASYVMEELM